MIDLEACARILATPGKGLLAADESNSTADKRLAANNIPQTEEMRRQYRDLFLGTPGIEEYLSGVILYKETLEQKGNNGKPFAAHLHEIGVVPGIKVDEGVEPMAESPEEKVTNGLVGLPERLADFRAKHHTGFTKWRAVIKIEGDTLPTSSCIVENAKRLAMYSRYVQEAGMVPVVEPEVLLDGNHSRVRARAVIEDTLSALFSALEDQAVDLPGVILKTSMALSGKDSGRKDTPEEVAEDTVAALMKTVPAQLLGVVFLSGGQTPDQATDNLRAINRLGQKQGAPWPLSFSYARALQEEGLALWAGKPENVEKAREAFMARLAKVAAAARGE